MTLSKLTELLREKGVEVVGGSLEALKSGIEQGKVYLDPWVSDALEKIDIQSPDHTIDTASLYPFEGGVVLRWSTVSAGCGQCKLHLGGGGAKLETYGCSLEEATEAFQFILENAEQS